MSFLFFLMTDRPIHSVIPTEVEGPRIFFRLTPNADRLIFTAARAPRNPAYGLKCYSVATI